MTIRKECAAEALRKLDQAARIGDAADDLAAGLPRGGYSSHEQDPTRRGVDLLQRTIGLMAGELSADARSQLGRLVVDDLGRKAERLRAEAAELGVDG